MTLYSDYPAARARQIIADVVALTLALIAASIGAVVTATIRTFAGFGRDLEAAGVGFQTGLSDAADALGDVPLIGDGIRGPFDAAAGAGEAVAEAGRGQQAFIEAVAVGSGLFVALVPLGLIALVWLIPRVRFARRSTELRSLIARGLGADTLASRALARTPLRELTAVHPDPAAAWRANDAATIRALAALELRRAGIRADALP